MGGYASGKRSWAISDRSGLRFPYTEMVREWNGMLVHTSEYEPTQPQLDPKPVGSDPQALWNPRPQPASVASLILLDPNPFTTVLYLATTYVNVYSVDHQRSTGDTVRLRGPAQVTSAGSGGAESVVPEPPRVRTPHALPCLWGAGRVFGLRRTDGGTSFYQTICLPSMGCVQAHSGSLPFLRC